MPAATELVPPTDIIVLGRIGAAYGLLGEVRVYPYADDPPGWSRLSHWWIGREGDTPDLWQQTKLIRCRVSNESLIAQLACAVERNAAEAMRGLLVGAPRAALPATASDEYYWADLVGLDVINTHEQALGRVVGLLETPANTVLCVGDGEGKERLLPFVAAVVLDVDLARRAVRVEWETDW